MENKWISQHADCSECSLRAPFPSLCSVAVGGKAAAGENMSHGRQEAKFGVVKLLHKYLNIKTNQCLPNCGTLEEIGIILAYLTACLWCKTLSDFSNKDTVSPLDSRWMASLVECLSFSFKKTLLALKVFASTFKWPSRKKWSLLVVSMISQYLHSTVTEHWMPGDACALWWCPCWSHCSFLRHVLRHHIYNADSILSS